MSEEEKENNVKEISHRNADEGDKPKPADIIDRANEAAKRLEEQNNRFERLLGEQKELEARRRFGGSTDGRNQEEKTVEETPKDYMKRLMSGGLNKQSNETE